MEEDSSSSGDCSKQPAGALPKPFAGNHMNPDPSSSHLNPSDNQLKPSADAKHKLNVED